MNIVLDIVITVILLNCVANGYKKGLVNMILSLALSIASVVVSISLAWYISEPLYNVMFKELVLEKISNALTAGTSHMAFYDNLPAILSNILREFEISEKFVASAGAEAAVLIESYIAPTLVMIVSALVFVISFVLLYFVVKPLQKLLTRIFKFPPLSIINKLLGGAMGIAEAFLCLVVIFSVIHILTPYSNELNKLVLENIDSTFIFKHLYNNGITKYLCEFFNQIKYSGGLNLV